MPTSTVYTDTSTHFSKNYRPIQRNGFTYYATKDNKVLGALTNDTELRFYDVDEFTRLATAEMQAFQAKEAAQAAQDASTRTASDSSASTDSLLLQPQRAMALGAPIPVVFARRRTGGTGGVLHFPLATEAAFSNNTSTVTASYHCVLGQGTMPGIETRDVRNGASRQGTYSQNYDLRAGTWAPGNQITAVAGLEPEEFPQVCGVGGNYAGVSTIEFTNSYPIGSDRWKRCWSVFVRGGMVIERGRLIDNVVGPSDNICDLLIWALVESGQRTIQEIDLPQMLAAARFIEAEKLYCNAVFQTLANIPEWLVGILPLFLLRETTVDGRWAVAPLPPVNTNGSINVGPLTPDWTLSEMVIAPGSLTIKPRPAESRRPLQIVARWRQQTSEIHPPLVRDLLVGVNTDQFPTQEDLDLTGVATSEAHAALVAGWRHAARTIGAATATVTLLRGSHTGRIRQGDVVWVLLQIRTEIEPDGQISGFWWVDRVDLTPAGGETLQLIACPIDEQNRSLLALRAVEFRGAAPGRELPYPDVSEGDVPGRELNTSVPAATTSGRPFSAGGGGITGGGGGTNSFNRSEVGPPAPPASPPPPGDPDAPGGAGGGEIPGDTATAGSEPQEEDDKKKPEIRDLWGIFLAGRDFITAGPWLGCDSKYGKPQQIRYQIQGTRFTVGTFGETPQNFGITTQPVKWLRESAVGVYLYAGLTIGGEEIYPSQYLNATEISYENLSGEVTSFTVYDGQSPLYPYSIQPVERRCVLPDGSLGPAGPPT